MLNKKSPARGEKKQNEGLWYYSSIAVIIFIVFGLTISFFPGEKIKEKSYDTAVLENIITELKIEKLTIPESGTKGKVIPPASQYEAGQLRQSLNLPEPEEEENNIKLQHEEILKNTRQFQYAF
jgi:hypothetical protein